MLPRTRAAGFRNWKLHYELRKGYDGTVATPSSRIAARREREHEIIEATRALFDERGEQAADIDAIARAVGVNRAIIYRHFESKDELFALTVEHYLDDLDRRLAEAGDAPGTPPERLRAITEAFVDFCLEHPAFLDCALSLMRRPAAELASQMRAQALFRLGRAIATPLARLSGVLSEGAASGDFAVDDPDLVANLLYAQGLGTMHLARVAAGVHEVAPGVAGVFPIDPDAVRALCVRGVLALVRP